MKELEEKIVKEGTVLPGNILKVGSFLNHQLDVELIMRMGSEIARIYETDKPTKVLTIESSGIAIAVGAAAALHVPAVFAKKNKTGNLSGELYTSVVHSYTHGVDNTIVVSKDYLCPGDRIVIVDDFLASGNALIGLLDIVKQAGAAVIGCSCAIEKGFQDGGDKLRRAGIRVESLAVIDQMDQDAIVFRH